ncbi:MAG: hypothetical protein IJ944_04755 [Clostridia bacterium]|nr:hypothetical protein [Clostridia bacterium]
MSLFILLAALAETINETIKEKIEDTRAEKEKRKYENIDFNNIDYVTFDGTEPAYRIEVEEEFDPVMTNFLSDLDGWAHYETKEAEYEVPDGENYCFTIRYKDGSEIYRMFHEDSPLTKRLLEYCINDFSKEINEVVDAISNIGLLVNEDQELPLMCPHCKAKIPQESVYCCYCGKKI